MRFGRLEYDRLRSAPHAPVTRSRRATSQGASGRASSVSGVQVASTPPPPNNVPLNHLPLP